MPLDQETKDLLAFAEGFSAEQPTRAPVDKETEDLLAFAESYQPGPPEPTAAQRGQAQAARAEEARLTHARGELEESYLPSMKAYAIEAGAGIVSPIARLVGKEEYADRMVRFANTIEQVAREREEGGIIPDILKRGARGAAVSLTTMVPAAAVAGPYGAIAAASAQEANRAITEGKDAGKKGRELAGYAVAQGVIEGIPATVMQRIGLGGVESMVSKKSVSLGLIQGLKRLGITAAHELPEEIVTELGHNVAAAITGVEPNALSPENLQQTVAETTVQTLITVGFAGAPSVARSVEAGKTAQTTEEIQTYAREGKVPSRKTWRKWKFAPEVGGSRSQRQAFIREVAKQVEPPPVEVEPEVTEPPIVPGAPEGTIPAPTAVAPVPGAVEGIETGLEPEAVQEAEKQPWEMTGEEFSGTYARPALKMKDGEVLTSPRRHLDIIEHQEKYGYDDVAESGWSYKGEYVSEDEMKAETTGKALGWPEAHRVLIRRAIERGERVPAEVLAEHPDLAPEAAQEAPGAAVEAEAAPPVRPEVLEGLEAPASEEETVALNNAAGAEIRELLGIEKLPEGRKRSAKEVMERVAAGKGDEKALDIAQGVIREPRMLEPYEHVSMVLKTRKLMKDLRNAKAIQAEAAQSGDVATHKKAIIDRETISIQLDDLTTASQYTGTEISEAFSIRQLRLSLESYDIVDVLAEMQASKKPGDRLSGGARKSAVQLTDEGDDLTGRIAKLEDELRIKDEKLEAALAQKVVEAHKPRKSIGKSIREKSVARQNEFKERIRQMGHRVNDISGVSVEGTYLIGRVGIEYIVQGAGTLIEVAERLRADLPDLNLTDQDVNRALIQRSPKEKTRMRSEATKRKTKLLSMARMHVEMEDLANGIAKAAKKKAPIPADIKKLRKELTRAREEYYYVDLEAAKLERAVDKVNLLQTQLDGDLKRAKKTPREVSPALAKINEEIRRLTTTLGVKGKLAETEKQLKTGEVVAPPKRVKKLAKLGTPEAELERMQIQLMQNRRAIRQLIADQAPWTVGKVVDETFESFRTLMATGEVSFTLRQNQLQVFSHPIKAIERFAKSIVPIFKQNTADKIIHDLRTSENGAIYDLSGLAIMDSESPGDAQRSEIFRANLIQKVPILGSVIRASARHGVAFSNVMRAGGMDWFVGMYPNATRAELNAWANWQNTTSGLGSLWKFAQAVNVINKFIFAPKFSASRVQTPLKVFQHWQYPRVRKAIARDMVRAVATGVGVMSLASLGFGATVEWWDPDDADWWKIRIGNSRFDIWGSYLQPARLVARILRGASVRVGLVEEGIGYRPADFLELFGRFAAFKVSPPVSIMRELLTGKTAVGEEATPAGTLVRHTTMLFLQDIYDAAREYNSIPAAGGIGVVAGIGVGVATYEDSEYATRKKAEKLWARGERGEARLLVAEWNRQPENRDNQIVTFKKTPKK